MTQTSETQTPVIILASRGSQGSYLASLLGAHPDLYAAPHINLLPFEFGWQYLTYCTLPRDTNAHGLLRMVAQALIGEQTMQSIQAARRWMNVRRHRKTIDIYHELGSLVAPQRLVDYSPLYAQNLDAMRRATAAFPDALVIHLTSNPKSQAEALVPAIWQTVLSSQEYWGDRGPSHPCMDSYELGEQFIDWSVHPPVLDPQFAWYRTQNAARQLFEELPDSRCLRMTSEQLMTDPKAVLKTVLPRLGVSHSAKTMTQMLKDDDCMFSKPGPFGTVVGVDYEMLGKSVRDMTGQGGAENPIDPDAPLTWRGDNDVFQPQVIDLARELGYPVI